MKFQIPRLKPVSLFAAIVLVLLIIISLFVSGKFWGWLILFPYLGDKIQQWLGIGYWESRAISIPVAMFIIFYLPWLFSFKKNRRTRALISIASVGTFLCIGMSLAYKDRNFDPQGKAVKCVTRNVWGQLIETSCGPAYDSISGEAVVPMTPSYARELEIAKSGPPKFKRAVLDYNTRFFSAKGDPLLWYYKYPDGKLEFFLEPGMHPVRNIALSPINKETVSLLFYYFESGREDMLIMSKTEGNWHYSREELNGFSGLKKLKQTLEELED